MIPRKLYFRLRFFITLTVIAPASAFSASKTAISPELEKAILAEDWQRVVTKCGPNEGLTSLPVLRAIKAHGCLTLNQNNQSLLLFLSITNDSDLVTWDTWTQEFSQKHSKKSIAHYFRGDALARLGKFDLAIQSFNKALNYNSDFVLALNARGVALAYKKQWKEADEDFERACEIAPTFAEAYTSHGTLLILKKAPEGAEIFFNKALTVSPDFALALNGRGCAEFARRTRGPQSGSARRHVGARPI